MTYKTNKKYILTTVAVLAAAITGVFALTTSFDANIMNNDGTKSTVVSEPEDVIHPRDLPRQGMPFLVTYELAIQPEKYHSIDAVSQSWLVDLIEKGEAPVNQKNLDEYFKITEDGNQDFGLTIDGVTKYFEIEFYENPVTSPTGSYVKAYRMFDDRMSDGKAQFEKIDLKSKPKLKKIFDDDFSWVEIDEQTAKDLKLLMKDKKLNLEVDKNDGPAKYDIRYFGPYFETVGGS